MSDTHRISIQLDLLYVDGESSPAQAEEKIRRCLTELLADPDGGLIRAYGPDARREEPGPRIVGADLSKNGLIFANWSEEFG